MLQLPGTLTAESFLARHWQQEYLFMPQALPRIRPSLSRNELGWLATLDDVESRLVFTKRNKERLHYLAETGPFEADYLAALPRRDWTLLVHDVEKHVPALRRLFQHVPFIPDWRIDDLMVSFAAPGGGVGPHRDNYDVFLCQGTGIREWRVSSEDVAPDPSASDNLALLSAFAGEQYTAREGDILYVPPGVAHWGTARRACMTYSIGMRAPQVADLADKLPDAPGENRFYSDRELEGRKNVSGYIDAAAVERALRLLECSDNDFEKVAAALGRFATETKSWIRPDTPTAEETRSMLLQLQRGARLNVHGMARIAFDDVNMYVNGRDRALPEDYRAAFAEVCEKRRYRGATDVSEAWQKCLEWMLKMGAFEIPENL